MKNTVFAKLSALALCLTMLISAFAGCAGKQVTEPTKDNVQSVLDNKNQGSAPIVDANGNTFIGVDPDSILKGDDVQNNIIQNNGTQIDNLVQSNGNTANVGNRYEELGTSPKGNYNKGIILIKSEDAPDVSALSEYGVASVEPLYEGADWYLATLVDADKTEDVVQALYDLKLFDAVDYDYIMGADAEAASASVSGNPDFEKSKHFGPHGIQQGWAHLNDHDRHPGGSSDVIVAVIDTGVDYNHLDLRNNIWVNSAEIPNNGIDDDGNGYVDDINGWNCVGNNNNPMDDNGHGTHVAGIIAAENNKIGGVGVAYNCKIMVLKAGNSSGYFNNSDIAEAIQYAYMNGASVINMSFGGSNISVAVEDALENAYNACVLVAAAGNDGLCNNLSCQSCDLKGVSYPAALPYVIGVMSVNSNGSAVSSFSNYDHKPYDSVEYEVYAVGETIPSTWPGNKYATLQGTSMAAPSVSGIAALLRSYYSDRDAYSTKFIQSQIVNTGTLYPYNANTEEVDDAHSIANVYEALTQLPKPEVNLYDYYIDDSAIINAANNGNGIIDAGETVRLYISLHNRGGVATNVNVSADVIRGENVVDPYFTFVNSTITLSDIGTYSVRESGDKYFEIQVSADCPNDYLADFNIHYTYENGMDFDDTTVYTDDDRQKAQFNVSRGWYLPATITEDTVYTADRLYIVADDVVIPEGVTVTFEEGCEIQFYADKEYYNSPRLIVYGALNMTGSKGNMVKAHPSERYANYVCLIENKGTATIKYAELVNVLFYSSRDGIGVNNGKTETIVSNSYIIDNPLNDSNPKVMSLFQGKIENSSHNSYIKSITNSYIEHKRWNSTNYFSNINNCYLLTYADNAARWGFENGLFNNNVVCMAVTANNQAGRMYFDSSSIIANNLFLTVNDSLDCLLALDFNGATNIQNNSFSPLYQQYASQVIDGYYDSTGNPAVDVYGTLADPSLLYPYVMSVELFNKDGELVNTIGKEEIKVRVTFNRPMDTTKDTFVTFGTIEPYADYRIDGAYVSDTVWEGTYTLKAQIENGQNYIKVNNACAAEDPTMEVHGEYMLHEFTIDTTATLSMNLFAEPLESGIKLTWMQDDYDTLMGYNIYRSEEKDGNYVKLNPAILLSTDEYFIDENAEPGKTYWYTFTVVLSDFTESAPAGKVTATAIDTELPNMYHTPVNQGYMNNNLVISCTASDNVGIANATLYYRTVGETTWKTLTMSKVNDKYSATVFGSELTMSGLEYYIEATDGRNTIAKGSAETPYTVVVKDASAISRLGDVDGDNTVTTKDALMIMQSINGDLLLTDDQFKRADLNEDGVLSSVEALRILQYINGKVNTLEM